VHYHVCIVWTIVVVGEGGGLWLSCCGETGIAQGVSLEVTNVTFINNTAGSCSIVQGFSKQPDRLVEALDYK
jgi:hypothetical protein